MSRAAVCELPYVTLKYVRVNDMTDMSAIKN